jgi:hypothetical protein
MLHELNVWEEDGKIYAVMSPPPTALRCSRTRPAARRTHLDTQQ